MWYEYFHFSFLSSSRFHRRFQNLNRSFYTNHSSLTCKKRFEVKTISLFSFVSMQPTQKNCTDWREEKLYWKSKWNMSIFTKIEMRISEPLRSKSKFCGKENRLFSMHFILQIYPTYSMLQNNHSLSVKIINYEHPK